MRWTPFAVLEGPQGREGSAERVRIARGVWCCARGCADSREACGDVGDNEGDVVQKRTSLLKKFEG